MVKIQILLSTFNGERYLKEQMDSYLRQKGDFDIRILVRDDGSTDRTLEILRTYRDKIHLDLICGENIGVNQSMRQLFAGSDKNCDYFAISDQDDVWCDDKLQRAVTALSAEEDTLPLLYASASKITDSRMKPIGESNKLLRGVSFYNAMVQNVCPGHTQVFNRALLTEIIRGSDRPIHIVDWWLYLVASATGKVLFDPQCTVLHRQHEINAVGYQTSAVQKIRKRLRYIQSGKAGEISRQLRSFYEEYGGELPEEYRAETEGYLLGQRNFWSRLRWIIRTKAYRQKSMETFWFKLLYGAGIYNISKEQSDGRER